MLTGLIGLGIGPNAAFRWTLYILLSLWPVSIYLAARLFGASGWAAAASAAMSPLVLSVTGVGYEQIAYLWVGYGVWTQLWASLALPLAWGATWRAIRDGRGYFLAAVAVSLTVALHFETGYLALMPLTLWPLVYRKSFIVRLRRAGLVTFGALLASAWVIVPLITQRTWAATNEILHGSPLADGYGGKRVLSWLVSGQLLDAHRLPILTLAAGIGLALAFLRWRADENGRALFVAFAACLLLSFGRTTFGALADAVPGSSDIFFRRFMMGIQLAALLLAGTGAAWSARLARTWLEAGIRRARPIRPGRIGTGLRGHLVAIILGLALLAPAWLQLLTLDRHNAASVKAQARADRSQGAQINRILTIIKRGAAGRVYAGMPSNWGMDFVVGAVPVFKYLESRDVDEVGYTLRTASLMTDPEFYFDEHNPGDYSLFGIRYLIVPLGRRPPIHARSVTCAGVYCLWGLSGAGYIHAGRVVGALAADRSNVGIRSVPLLRSPLVREQSYLRLSLADATSTPTRVSQIAPPLRRDDVLAESSDLKNGLAYATLRMQQPGIAVLSASIDPGWTAQVDGDRQEEGRAASLN